MVDVHLKHISRIFDAKKRPAVNRVDIQVRDGEFLCLVGPSGSGKSTCLRMLAGLEPVDEGSVLIGGKDVTDLRPRDRDVAMVFQSYALYPNMTARQNMSFALENAKVPKKEVAERVAQAAKMLELEELLDRRPSELSGGQRQRVSMGRAIVREPKVFLMDEPLSNLDARLRVSTRAQISALQRELGVTTVYVTHDQTEAMTMGDRVAVLKDGELQQCDEPMHMYRHPGNTFVAGFIGSPAMALIDAVPVRDGEIVLTERVRFAVPEPVAGAAGDRVILGVRPEDWEVTIPAGAGEQQAEERGEDPGHDAAGAGSGAGAGGVGLAVEVSHVEQLGAEAFAYVTVAEQGLAVREERIAVRLNAEQANAGITRGDRLWISPRRASLFDPETEVNLEYL